MLSHNRPPKSINFPIKSQESNKSRKLEECLSEIPLSLSKESQKCTKTLESSNSPREFLNMNQNTFWQVGLSFRNQMCIDCGQRGDRRLMTNTCHLMEFEPTCLPGIKKVCSKCKGCSYRWDLSGPLNPLGPTQM